MNAGQKILYDLFEDILHAIPELPVKDQVKYLQVSFNYAAPEREFEFWQRLSVILNQNSNSGSWDGWEYRIAFLYNDAAENRNKLSNEAA